MFRFAAWRRFLPLVVLLLVGCAAGPGARYRTDRAPDRYVLEGRFSLREGERAFHGRLRWQHSAAGEHILVQDPFGAGVAELRAGQGGARVVTSDGAVNEAADAGELMHGLTGVALPVGRVARWLTGRETGAREVERDAAGRVVGILAEGWRIRYDYAAASGADLLPARVVAANGQGIELRLAVEAWELDHD